ncbi:arabinan endo-1,5-alpha-L-arabinosidase [Dyadobacter koreensis]|uniref:Arabinan endo-1,5-alpha-L-arabinosidase n=1 Tax=Dyadobacter koreensis TaxID=408657 RepID=A0A1H6ZMN6_9BACT|nr:family 43 glycosylhydrolase [Dyadobacter koreensis]SEJ50075.1 arabinan endo-1,5-alpha-L-arabinosidase [Dyadobacter koreensis]
MKRLQVTLLTFLTIFWANAFAQTVEVREKSPRARTSSHKYHNPVFEPILADPTIVKADDGWFYAYGTQDNWGDGNPAHLVAIVRSKDLVNWTYEKDAFLTKPSWKEKGGIWAPEVVKVNGKYHMYYAFSTWGDPDPGIGLAVADAPAGPFIDQGKLFSSKEINVPNSIDPFYIEDQGKKYLFWGSFSDAPTQGTYGVELSEDGKSVPNPSKKIKVAAGDFEAVMIHKRDGFYYFLGSKESCCEAADSKYNVRVGRSKNLFGPYVDKDGKDLRERKSGSVLLQRTQTIAGPGHNSRLITDSNGNDWILYHAIDVKNPKVPTGANRRFLMLDKVSWKNGWPEILNAEPSMDEREAPFFK